MGIPEPDLVIAAHGGNYDDPVAFRMLRLLIPEYVVPAVLGR